MYDCSNFLYYYELRIDNPIKDIYHVFRKAGVINVFF